MKSSIPWQFVDMFLRLNTQIPPSLDKNLPQSNNLVVQNKKHTFHIGNGDDFGYVSKFIL